MSEMKLSRLLLFFFLLLSSSSVQHVWAAVSQVPVTRGALDGLSREALINLILGKKSADTTAKSDTSAHPAHEALGEVTPSNSSSSSSSALSKDSKFYLYPLDKKYWWRWPDHNSSCTAHNQVGHNHAMNSGQSLTQSLPPSLSLPLSL